MGKIQDKIKALHKDPISEAQVRLWGVFLNARIALALVLVLIQLLLQILQGTWDISSSHLILLAPLILYLGITVAIRSFVARGKLVYHHRLILWMLTAGLDIVVFIWMYWASSETGGYFMLFMFSILMIATLGPSWLVYATCLFIGFFVIMRAGVFNNDFLTPSAQAHEVVPEVLRCLGLFVVGELTHQLAKRMRREEKRASIGASSAKQQEVLNRLIVSEMGMGVIVTDRYMHLKTINPAAIVLITGDDEHAWGSKTSRSLIDKPGWLQLQEVIRKLFESEVGGRWLVFDVTLKQGSNSVCTLQVKGRIIEDERSGKQNLCVLFLTDMRDVDRRMQQEKLAAMGRMSASIAHEIRNPLATISSANMLLSEGLEDEGNLRLSQMIATNSDRLGRIVTDVLEVAHMQIGGESRAINLQAFIPKIVDEWIVLKQPKNSVKTQCLDKIAGVYISFDEDHLRRIMNNLLDNALRYASDEESGILVALEVFCISGAEKVKISVYSDGQPLDTATEHALFEPFFSTEARGTGLGLYICRNLCNRHSADLEYKRVDLTIQGKLKGYNEFYIAANRVDPLPGEAQILLEQV